MPEAKAKKLYIEMRSPGKPELDDFGFPVYSTKPAESFQHGAWAIAETAAVAKAEHLPCELRLIDEDGKTLLKKIVE